MTSEDALALVRSMKTDGVELLQRGRGLHITSGADRLGLPLRDLISANWDEVARAVRAVRHADKAIAAAARIKRAKVAA